MHNEYCRILNYNCLRILVNHAYPVFKKQYICFSEYNNLKGIINIGILAHVDAGKTSITENFLFHSRAIKSMGNVDQGSSVTDSMELEKERGISIRSASVSFKWKDHTINLIDTPGHTDFSSEVERALSVLDGAILLISTVEGVQAHTLTLWEGIKNAGIPCLFFINKIDRAGADVRQVLKQIEKELKTTVFPLNVPLQEGDKSACATSIFNKDIDPIYAGLKEQAIEMLAEKDEEILELFLEEKTINEELIRTKLAKLCLLQVLIPLYCGSAKYGQSINELLDGIIEFLPKANSNNEEDLAATVFKLEHDKSLGRIAHLRIFSGNLKIRDLVYNASRKKEEKIAQIKKIHADKWQDANEIVAGDIGIVSGWQHVQAGDLLGNPDLAPKPSILQKPVITVSVKAVREQDYAQLAKALTLLNIEDPRMGFKWFKEEREMHLNLMGSIQIEILKAILEKRFGIETVFSDPSVIYKETPSGTAEATVEYTMPKPCWAVMRFRIAPGEPDSGIQYKSEVSVNDIHRKYQNEIEASIPKALEQGIRGWNVTDIIVTLLAGEDHEIHSRPGDFILATPMGLMRALQNSGTTLLEPIYKFDISSPEEYLGSISSDLTKMRGSFDPPEFENNTVHIKGKLPVSTSLKYSIRLSSLTAGKGRLRMQFGGYQACAEEHGKSRKYKGVNPLDTSQWILHKRGGFKADERRF
ncbi:GTP-binding protein [Bacteroidota bacterium]